MGKIKDHALEEENISLKIIQDMQDWLPDYIDMEYPKGSADRGHATVHIIEFLLEYKNRV